MGRLYTPQELAQDVLAASDRDKAMVVVPRKFRMFWRMHRLTPTGFTGLFGAMARREERRRRTAG
jgi:hypothetical protein